jgi:hypothetical protein
LRVSDPGVYIIHCHILQHMVMGRSCLVPLVVPHTNQAAQACQPVGFLEILPLKS